ncbi:MAG: helix-turn-helix domain-containing protein [Planctomycetes bacterium]|nr:helix-turn-helix domain-containing protein [Planctomycetota bacterium]
MNQPVLPLVSRRAASQLLGISQTTLWRFVRRQELPFVRLGTRLFFDSQDLRLFIQRHKSSRPVRGRRKPSHGNSASPV